MKHNFKLVPLLLITVFLLNSCATQPQTNLTEAEVTELAAAKELGIIPKGLKYGGDITAKEFISLLRQSIQVMAGNEEILNSKIKSLDGESVLRQDAAIGLNFTAEAIGLNPMLTNTTMGNTGLDTMQEWPAEFQESDLFNVNYWDVIYTEEEGDYMFIHWAAAYATQQVSYANGYRLMNLDDNQNFGYIEPLTRLDAIQAVYRLCTSKLPEPRYVDLTEVGLNTISQDAIKNRIPLPPMSASNLPVFHGAYMQNKSSVFYANAADGSRNYEESVVRFLSENGFRFMRVDFSFSSLSAPDYSTKKINLNELEDLDKLISWGLKYGVHVCIAMQELPGLIPQQGQGYSDTFSPENHPSRIFSDTSIRDNVKNYWQMLATRYANIPQENLSFLMIVEPEAKDEKNYAETYAPIMEAIWAANPKRTIFNYADPAYPDGQPEFNTTVAKMGSAMAWSFYAPNYINYYGSGANHEGIVERYPKAETPTWPALYLPASFEAGREGRDTLTFTSDIPLTQVEIDIDKFFASDLALLTVSANGVEVTSKTFTFGPDEDRNSFPQEEWIVDLPEGTTTVEYKLSGEGAIRQSRIVLNGSSNTPISMVPYDIHTADVNAVLPVIHIDSSGTPSVEGSDLAVDFDYLYNWDLKWFEDQCKKYNTDFFIAEWGPFGEIAKVDAMNYRGTILGGFQDYGISWNTSLTGQVPNHLLVSKYNDINNATDFWKNINTRYVKLDYSDKYYVNMDLLELFNKYVSK